jgi:uncharacterized protein (DUF433 family)
MRQEAFHHAGGGTVPSVPGFRVRQRSWVAGTRVSLDSLVCRFREGLSAESIAENFPALSLEQVYGAIACYLANQSQAEEYLRDGERLSAQRQQEGRRSNADLIARLQRERHESQVLGC